MSTNNEKLCQEKVREIFNRYDLNKDQKLEKSELEIFAADIYKNNSKITGLNQDDKKKIDETVRDLILILEKNNAGKLDFKEFLQYYKTRNLIINKRMKNIFKYRWAR